MPTATPPCRFTRIQLVTIPSTDQDRSNRAGLVDEMHLVLVPILRGSGEHLLDDLDRAEAGDECVELVRSPAVAHARFARPCRGTQVAR